MPPRDHTDYQAWRHTDEAEAYELELLADIRAENARVKAGIDAQQIRDDEEPPSLTRWMRDVEDEGIFGD